MKSFPRQSWRKPNAECSPGVSISSGKRNFTSNHRHMSRSARRMSGNRSLAELVNVYRDRESLFAHRAYQRSTKTFIRSATQQKLRPESQESPEMRNDTRRNSILKAFRVVMIVRGRLGAGVTAGRGSEEQEFSIFRTRRNHFPFALSAKASSADNGAEIVPWVHITQTWPRQSHVCDGD